MKKKMAIVLVLLLTLSVSAGAGGYDHPCMMDDDMLMGGGMGMGYGMSMMGMGQGIMGYGMGMMGGGADMMGPVGPYGMLDLSPEQRAKINKLLDDLRKQHLAVMGKMLDEQAKLRDLFNEEKLDAKKIGAAYDALSAHRRKLVESRVDATNGIREILTKEQRDQLKQIMRGKGRGMGPGTGGGPMHRGMTGP
jgi:Spy/CpxP family protein refolding chaperone